MPNDRPTSFDARVMQYLPGLRKRAWRYVQAPEARQDLVTDTIIYALTNWQGFREDGGFWNWLTWCMRSVVSNRTQAAAAEKRQGRMVPIENIFDLSTPSTQASRDETSSALRGLGLIKNGDITLRHAMGEEAETLAAERGCSKDRIHQINQEVREKLGRFL